MLLCPQIIDGEDLKSSSSAGGGIGVQSTDRRECRPNSSAAEDAIMALVISDEKSFMLKNRKNLDCLCAERHSQACDARSRDHRLVQLLSFAALARELY